MPASDKMDGLAKQWHEYTTTNPIELNDWGITEFYKFLDNQEHNPYGLHDVEQFIDAKKQRGETTLIDSKKRPQQ